MPVLIVTSNPDDWPFEIPGVDKIDAWNYLTSPQSVESSSGSRSTRVFNLCRSYRYQSLGYYVSLLAEARGLVNVLHESLPQRRRWQACVDGRIAA